ncbi:hypothetical protein L7F22_034404 [Adiantum nelumboides]|nr:hypothetical protein [Adiantum nelumboides]
MSLFFNPAFSPMELLVTAMVLATVLCASVRVTHDDSSNAAAQQRKLTCSRTFWCCDRAPRGWQLFQLFCPWIILLVLGMPCLSATGESLATPEAGWLQSSQHLLRSDQVHDQEPASISHPVTDGIKNAISSEGFSVTALRPQASKSSEAELPGSSAQEELLPPLCMLPGWANVWQAFLSLNVQIDSSVEITVQASLVREEGVTAILEWGSNRLNSVAFKLLSLSNRQSNVEIRVSKILTSNAQFCTVDFQEVVISPGSRMPLLIAYIPNSIGKVEGSMVFQTSIGSFKVKNLGEGVPSLIETHPAWRLGAASRAQWRETISLVNSFADPVSVKEAYLWVESAINETKGEGVLCRKVDVMLECSHCRRLKVKPIEEWSVAPYSSTPVLDFSLIYDDTEHLVGTLCLKIYWHSIQLSEFLVVPMKLKWLRMTEAFGKKTLLEAEEVDEDDGVWSMFEMKALTWQPPGSEEFDSSQRTNMLITTLKELEHGPLEDNGANDLIGFRGGNILPISRVYHITEALVSAFLVPYSALLPLFANCGLNDDGKGRCLAKRAQCAESRSSRDCLNMLLVQGNDVHDARDEVWSFVRRVVSEDMQIVIMRPFSLQEPLQEGLQEIFDTGCVPWSMSLGIISLIPKGGDASTMRQSRPITLMSSVYKILARMITARQRPLLLDLIHSSQTGFVQGLSRDALASKARLYKMEGKAVSAKVKGVTCACGHEFFCHYKSDSRHMPVGRIASQCLNKGIQGLFAKLTKVMTCSALFSPANLAEAKKKHKYILPDLSILYFESSCGVSEGFTHSWLACKSSDSSVSTGLDTLKDKEYDRDKGVTKYPYREKDTGTSFILQDSSFMRLQKVTHGPLNEIESGNVNLCVPKNVGLCKEPPKPLNWLDLSLDRAVAGGWCELHSFSSKDSMADSSLPVCHASLSFFRYKKFVLKVSLALLFSVFIVLVKMLRQEKLLTADVRLRHFCSNSFYLQSVFLKPNYNKGAERSSDFEHTPTILDAMNSLECPGAPCYENRLLDLLASVARSFGVILRWGFESQATILNVKVQIAQGPCTERASGYPRDACLVNDKNCGMGPNFVEKPPSFQSTSSVLATECIGRADNSRLKFFEANQTSPGGLSTTCYTAKSFSQVPSSPNAVDDLDQNFQVKEKKEKGKRRKRRNNIIDLKQDLERMGQSASSSPPSSPASPATPLGYGFESPFSRRSSSTHFSSEMLSQFDVRGDCAYCTSAKKGTSQHLPKFGSKAISQVSVEAGLHEKGSARKDSCSKDMWTGENWAAVVRRAIDTRNEPDQRQGFSSSSRSSMKGLPQARPVLLPSATFPQRGRSMQWTPRMLEKTTFDLSEQVTSPSLVSTSLIAPHARAPGSKPSMACTESQSGNDYRRRTLQVDKTGNDTDLDQGSRDDEFLYDIWGNHFAEFCRAAQPNALVVDANDAVGLALPASLGVTSLFAAQTRVLSYADAALSPISRPSSEGFSIFSRDAFYSPSQEKDTTGVCAPGS